MNGANDRPGSIAPVARSAERSPLSLPAKDEFARTATGARPSSAVPSTPPVLPLPASDALALLRAGPELAPREADLYVRYLRALALLGECAPFVDDADYTELIGALFADAQANYPLAVRRHGERWEVAPLL